LEILDINSRREDKEYNMEKITTKGKYQLIHSRYIDDMGFERDAFDLFDTEQRLHRPFFGHVKVNDKADCPINRISFDYTQDDYDIMLDEQISKVI